MREDLELFEAAVGDIIADQLDQEDDTLDADHKMDEINAEKQAEQKDLAWARGQLPTPVPSVLEAYLTDLHLPIKESKQSKLEQEYLASSEFSPPIFIAESASSRALPESEGVMSKQGFGGISTFQPHAFVVALIDQLALISEADPTPIEPAVLAELRKQQDDRLYDFRQYRIPSKIHTAFTAGIKRKDLPPEPASYRQLKGHCFEKQFRENMEGQINQHRTQFNSWDIVSSKEASGHQVLGCQWIFKYKTDKHNRLQKCKARLVVCDNQQHEHNLPTQATTLAITSLRVLLAITAKFDLETLQLDAVNAFVHADLDEMVFMQMLPGYTEQSKVLRLRKALYGLCRSFLLWQQKLTDAMKTLGFIEIPQEPCIVQKDGIICFFYVDDIVFAFKKGQSSEVKRIVACLLQTLTLEEKGKLK